MLTQIAQEDYYDILFPHHIYNDEKESEVVALRKHLI